MDKDLFKALLKVGLIKVKENRIIVQKDLAKVLKEASLLEAPIRGPGGRRLSRDERAAIDARAQGGEEMNPDDAAAHVAAHNANADDAEPGEMNPAAQNPAPDAGLRDVQARDAAARRRHTRIPGSIERAWHPETNNQHVREGTFLAFGYRKYMGGNLNDLTVPPNNGSASTPVVKSQIQRGLYFSWARTANGRALRYTPIGIFSVIANENNRQMLNKVIIECEDGSYWTASETIVMKWIRAREPNHETVLAFARGMAHLDMNGANAVEAEDDDGVDKPMGISAGEAHHFLSLMHKLDSAGRAVSKMDI